MAAQNKAKQSNSQSSSTQADRQGASARQAASVPSNMGETAAHYRGVCGKVSMDLIRKPAKSKAEKHTN